MKAKAIEMLEGAILRGELHYYRQTGSYAYVAQYDGELQIVYNFEARPGANLEILASAKWEDNLGNPAWTIRDDNGEIAVVISTEIDGTAIPDGVYYVP